MSGATNRREGQVAREIVARLGARRGGTWSLHAAPYDHPPDDGYLVSAPLMALHRRGVPLLEEVAAWLELNRRELTDGTGYAWRPPIKFHYETYAPPVSLPATAHRAARVEPGKAHLFFPGAWWEKATDISWLDVNICYPLKDEVGNDNLERAKGNARGWGQHSIRRLAKDPKDAQDIRVWERSLWARVRGAWTILKG
jgi:hypothetical protein